ncbi:MAG: mechanosensitive ion channel family protein, partial [Chlamydiota bacterium]
KSHLLYSERIISWGFSLFSESFVLNSAFTTLIFVTILSILRLIITKMIRTANRPWTSEMRLRSIGYVRSIFFGIVLLGLVYIWGEQVHNFAVSLFAIAFALVFSVKELCSCVNGSLMRFRGNIYNLGDRIEIGKIRGDVIDMNIFSTKILEVGHDAKSHHHTGRTVVFPNSMITQEIVVNESFIDHFYFHNIKIPLAIGDDWQRAHDVLLAIAKEECTPYLELARKRMLETAKQKSIVLPSVEPRIIVQMPDINKVHLILRFPGPVHLKGRLEQTILKKFLDTFFEKEALGRQELP